MGLAVSKNQNINTLWPTRTHTRARAHTHTHTHTHITIRLQFYVNKDCEPQKVSQQQPQICIQINLKFSCIKRQIVQITKLGSSVT